VLALALVVVLLPNFTGRLPPPLSLAMAGWVQELGISAQGLGCNRLVGLLVGLVLGLPGALGASELVLLLRRLPGLYLGLEPRPGMGLGLGLQAKSDHLPMQLSLSQPQPQLLPLPRALALPPSSSHSLPSPSRSSLVVMLRVLEPR